MQKKTKTIIIIILAVLLVAELAFLGFRALTNSGDEQETLAPTEAAAEAAVEVPTEAATEAPTEAATEAPTEAAAEAPMLYADPLTGEPLAQPHQTRIFGVTINNVPDALPHVGVNEAGLFFEMFINDYATRGMALYSDIRNVEVVGSVRSWRYNFTDLTVAYDLYSAHAGGSKEILNDAWNNKIEHINVENASGVSFRDKDRKSAGYDHEHTLMARGPKLYSYAEKEGIRVTQEEGKTYGLNFTADGTPTDGEAAGLINITFNHQGHKKLSTMTYDETLGKYVFTQYGKTADSVKEENLETFENVFVMLATVTNKGVYHVADLDGSGDGYYACGGKIIKIQWHHESPTDPITFTLEDGTPLVQGIGNSYIAICPLKSTVEWK